MVGIFLPGRGDVTRSPINQFIITLLVITSPPYSTITILEYSLLQFLSASVILFSINPLFIATTCITQAKPTDSLVYESVSRTNPIHIYPWQQRQSTSLKVKTLVVRSYLLNVDDSFLFFFSFRNAFVQEVKARTFFCANH